VARLVGLADVGLHLDDPAGDTAELGIVGDEPGAEQPARRLEGRSIETPPIERPRRGQERG
jgi:hypothetical protein